MAKSTRIAVIDKKKCSPTQCGFLCQKVCPGVRMGDETITLGEDEYPIISEALCTGCGICPTKCPFGAISIINLPHEIGEPIHQYGKNAFRVYNIPQPRKGVIGLVGPNGIGKTTLLKIMAGKLIPNLANFNEKPTWDKVVERYKSQEIGAYLTELSKGNTRLAYKPQDVTQIPKYFEGTVRELLEKSNEINELDKILTELDLNKTIDKNIKEISGGELQRVAITATMLKNADYYFFDEPSSFLDVKQRLKMSKAIRKLADEKQKSVIVVEHDLAVLDYLTDYVYVLYGKPSVYGIVSSLKNSRTGINEFLEGFLKAENTRIRDNEIRFEPKPPAENWQGKLQFSYDAFEKEFSNFKLTSEAGTIKEGEVISILGPNAIGKSTFIKVMAGVEKATQGDPGLSATISYKPQYISYATEDTVVSFITKQKIDHELFNAEFKQLLKDIYDKPVNSLSGGEQQKLAIAMAMSAPAEVCLLDEPSAFLDIEQRLNISQIIKRITEKKGITTMVVDHDIVFQDIVANRVLVFEGTPGKEGNAKSPESVHDGMNRFLSAMNVTFRRDENTKRPRVNKQGSQKDAQQKNIGEYYYTE